MVFPRNYRQLNKDKQYSSTRNLKEPKEIKEIKENKDGKSNYCTSPAVKGKRFHTERQMACGEKDLQQDIYSTGRKCLANDLRISGLFCTF